jgi:aspartate 1-decarboxylase
MRKRLLAIALSAVLALSGIAFFPQSAEAYTDSSLKAKYIGTIGSTTKTVYKGDDFEIEVRKGTQVRDNDIRWSIGNTSIVKFDDDDRTDDEIELRAVGTGTTKVTAKNLLTGGTLTYTVKVNSPKKLISRVGDKARTVKAGYEFELKVSKLGGIQDSDLYWSTSNSEVVKVVDDDRSDETIELKAVKAGKANVSCKNKITGGYITYNITVQKSSMTIKMVGSSTKTVEVGDDLELKVQKSGLSESQIKWTISDTSVLRFEDGDNIGSEIEVEARKKGTTTVKAKNLYTGGTLTYTVKVVPDYDD